MGAAAAAAAAKRFSVPDTVVFRLVKTIPTKKKKARIEAEGGDCSLVRFLDNGNAYDQHVRFIF
jgi:hypothetical protein